MNYDITLTSADLDAISGGGTVAITTPDATFELTDEDRYVGPDFNDGVCRIGLSGRELSSLRLRGRLTMLRRASPRIHPWG